MAHTYTSDVQTLIHFAKGKMSDIEVLVGSVERLENAIAKDLDDYSIPEKTGADQPGEVLVKQDVMPIELSQIQVLRHTVNARDAFYYPRANRMESPVSDRCVKLKEDVEQIKRHFEAAISGNELSIKPVFHYTNGSYVMHFWAPHDGIDVHHGVFIRPGDRTIDVNFTRESSLLQIRIMVPGEIMGTGLSDANNRFQRYDGLFFSTEPGERKWPLFPVAELIAKVVVMTKNDLIPNEHPSDDVDDGLCLG